jgi:predicted Zn-dependent peptidase
MTATVATLGNGVRIVLDPMPGLESASIGVWFKAGAVDETAEEHGVAHLLEHMAFKGTATRSARRIAEEIEAVGGYLNASTGYGRTGYYARVLRPEVDLGLEILVDILTNPLFDEGELAKEREVVIQEIGEAADQPDDAVMELLQAQSFGDHPLGRAILGTEQSVSSHGAERLRGFMAKNYAAEDLVIAAAGAIDEDRFVAQAERWFGARARTKRAPRTPAPVYLGGVAHDARDIEQTHIALALPGASIRAEDYFATRVFVEALGGGMSSRIFQSVREERGLAYSVYSFSDAYDDVGTVGAYVGTDSDSAAEAVGLIRREIEGMANAPTKAEVDRSKALLKSAMLMGLESPSTRAEVAVGQLYAHGRLLQSAEMRDRIDAVTIDDVRQAAAKAATGKATLAIVGPAVFSTVETALVA